MEDIIYGTIGAAIKGYCVRKNIDPLSIVKINKGRHAIITPQGGIKHTFFLNGHHSINFRKSSLLRILRCPTLNGGLATCKETSINEDLFRDAIYMHGCEKIAMYTPHLDTLYEANSRNYTHSQWAQD